MRSHREKRSSKRRNSKTRKGKRRASQKGGGDSKSYTQITKKIRKLSQCHPRVNKNEEDKGCLPVSVLMNVARKNKITVTPKNALQRIANHLKVDSSNQHSVLKALPGLSEEEKEKLAKTWLRPEQPSSWKEDPDAWLDTTNIRDVLKQYEEVYSFFKFFGPYPIDFAVADPQSHPGERCLINEMCSLDLKKELAAGKKILGFSFNLDPHYKSGSHWVAVVINIPEKECYYFDSYGMRPPTQIYKFMQWLTIQEPEMKLKMNAREFQRKNSECGMFCIYFIVCMVEGESFQDFCRGDHSDTLMLNLRNHVYSK
jgi:hypothetical protein